MLQKREVKCSWEFIFESYCNQIGFTKKDSFFCGEKLKKYLVLFGTKLMKLNHSKVTDTEIVKLLVMTKTEHEDF